jgi:hypothetical protein
MSNLKRYYPPDPGHYRTPYGNEMREDPCGNFVLYEDIKHLREPMSEEEAEKLATKLYTTAFYHRDDEAWGAKKEIITALTGKETA